MSEPKLAERCGLVLGVSTRDSVGFHCARALKAHGAEVAISYRDRPGSQGEPLASELGAPSVQLDARSDESIRSAMDSVGERFGRLDYLVHTLVHVPEGVLSKPLLEIGREDFALVLDVGVRSLIATTRYALPWLSRSPSPRIVALLSGGADFAIPNYHVVGIAKAALASTIRYLAHELGPAGVLCNGVSFSLIGTSAAERAIGADTTRRTAQYLVKRSMTHVQVDYHHVTGAISFLVSAECQNITGEILTVDGGFSRNYL